jgi:hypothetical protein
MYKLLQTVTLGDTKEDSSQKGKKKGSKHDKRKKKSGAKGKQGSDVPVAGEVDTRLLSALLTVSWSILQSCCLLCFIFGDDMVLWFCSNGFWIEVSGCSSCLVHYSFHLVDIYLVECGTLLVSNAII